MIFQNSHDVFTSRCDDTFIPLVVSPAISSTLLFTLVYVYFFLCETWQCSLLLLSQMFSWSHTVLMNLFTSCTTRRAGSTPSAIKYDLFYCIPVESFFLTKIFPIMFCFPVGDQSAYQCRSERSHSIFGAWNKLSGRFTLEIAWFTL